jgi:hypothetical protein
MFNKIIPFLILFFFTSACSFSQQINKQETNTKEFNLEEYLTGSFIGEGESKIYSENKSKKFTLKMIGNYKNHILNIDETYYYKNEPTKKEKWKFKKISDNRWEIESNIIKGQAEGREIKDFFTIQYESDLSFNNIPQKINLDIWMWEMANKNILSKTYKYKNDVLIEEKTIVYKRKEK